MGAPAPSRSSRSVTVEPDVSGLYLGKVVHRRFRPRRHALRYRVFWMLLDLDEIDALASRLKTFSRNHFNLFSFFDRDYGDRSGKALRAQIDRHLESAGISAGGPMTLLTMPRILGYAFNPLSIFFCHDHAGRLAAIFYEVSNTFGERHSYVIPVEDAEAKPIRQSVDKAFFVSPFLDMDLHYAFRVDPPGAEVMVGIAASDAGGPMINALLKAERVELTDKALLSAFVKYPFLTLKVIVAIHWEAVLLVLKRIGLRRKPMPPPHAVSVGSGRPAGD